MAQFRNLGIPSPRVEGEQKVSGAAIYAGDVTLPDMLYVALLRSPMAYARINRIDVSRAKLLPGVKAVLTGNDLSGVRIGKKIIDMPLLAEGVVRYIGEKVAAVAAQTLEVAKAALDNID